MACPATGFAVSRTPPRPSSAEHQGPAGRIARQRRLLQPASAENAERMRRRGILTTDDADSRPASDVAGISGCAPGAIAVAGAETPGSTRCRRRWCSSNWNTRSKCGRSVDARMPRSIRRRWQASAGSGFRRMCRGMAPSTTPAYPELTDGCAAGNLVGLGIQSGVHYPVPIHFSRGGRLRVQPRRSPRRRGGKRTGSSACPCTPS